MVALVDFNFTVTPADAMSRVRKAPRHHAKSAVVHIMASGTSSRLSTGCCSDSPFKTGLVPHRVVVSWRGGNPEIPAERQIRCPDLTEPQCPDKRQSNVPSGL